MSEIAVTATEANRSFSRLLRQVQQGDRVRVTSHGRTVAIIAAPNEDDATEQARRLAALKILQKRWAEDGRVDVGPWTRDDIYDRDRR